MTEPKDQHDQRIPDDERTLHAFGELPADRVTDVERAICQDPDARAETEAMGRLARLGPDPTDGPSADLLAATQASIRLAVVRRAKQRRIRIAAVASSLSAAAAIAIVMMAWQDTPTSTTHVVQVAKPAVSQPSLVSLTEADREVIRQTIAQLHLERTWDDPLDNQTNRLRRRLAAARFSASRDRPTPRRYRQLRHRIERLLGDVTTTPSGTQPAGSTRRPDQSKETSHA
jgi:hypothetical protein